MDEQIQYGINREVAKILALSSGNTNQYHHLSSVNTNI